MKKEKLVYHYTTLNILQSILQDGELKLCKAYTKKEVPALWFSKNQHWEPTAEKFKIVNGQMRSVSMEEQHKLAGCARIGIELSKELITWAKYRHISTIPDVQLDSMEEGGQMKNALPSDWLCMLKPLPISKVNTIEYWNGTEWMAYKPNLSI